MLAKRFSTVPSSCRIRPSHVRTCSTSSLRPTSRPWNTQSCFHETLHGLLYGIQDNCSHRVKMYTFDFPASASEGDIWKQRCLWQLGCFDKLQTALTCKQTSAIARCRNSHRAKREVMPSDTGRNNRNLCEEKKHRGQIIKHPTLAESAEDGHCRGLICWAYVLDQELPCELRGRHCPVCCSFLIMRNGSMCFVNLHNQHSRMSVS